MRSIFAIIVITIISCKPEPKSELRVGDQGISDVLEMGCEDYIYERKNENLNISILLDLSDRIDQTNQQVKDAAYIISLAQAFNTHVKSKKLGLLYDKIEVFFEPAPSDPKIFELSEQLKISFIKGVSKKEWLPKILERYSVLPNELYDVARSGSKVNGYPGSDTWRFFRDQVKDYCIDKCRRNILVILTDGYMYHENSLMKSGNKTSYLTPRSLDEINLNRPDWKKQFEENDLGFIPATEGLEDLEVLVIGITNLNEGNPYGQDILEHYWTNWFDAMKVKNYKIKNADIPSNMAKVIDEFIEG